MSDFAEICHYTIITAGRKNNKPSRPDRKENPAVATDSGCISEISLL